MGKQRLELASGFILSYTTFAYQNPHIAKDWPDADDIMDISVGVHGSGKF
ncbi:MAG: hypothetical protein RRA35_02550 [Desulfomonilia bacterium]|nr:hypothetical protein [Desulfomonilia bacterium]